jgi:hypothetical protein
MCIRDSFRVAGRTIKGAELAHGEADVGVVGVSVRHIADHGLRVQTPPHQISQAA